MSETAKKLRDSGVLVCATSEIEKMKEKLDDAYSSSWKGLQSLDRRNSTAALVHLIKQLKTLLEIYEDVIMLLNGYKATIERLNTEGFPNNNKRWTAEEDELLIELVAREKREPLSIALSLGRTPAAINARVSKLVGINRIDYKVAGHFLGTINGDAVTGKIDGIITKGAN